MDHGDRVLAHQVRLLKVFMLLSGRNTHEYERALLASICIWSRQKKLDSPMWRMFEQNACAFNEESGEVAFSCLAKQVARGGVRSNVDQVTKSFALMKINMSIAKDLRIELSGDVAGESSRYHIDPRGDDVKATVAFFRRTIREIANRTYRVYDRTLGAKPTRTAARKTVPLEGVQPLLRDVASDMDAVRTKLQDYLSTMDAFGHDDIWPQPSPFDDDSSEANGTGADSDADAIHGQSGSHPKRQDQRKRKRKRKGGSPGRDIRRVGAGAGRRPIKKVSIRSCVSSGEDDDVVRGPDRKSQDIHVGVILKVPVWKFGTAWAKSNFDHPFNSFLHMVIDQVDRTRSNPYRAKMLNPEEPPHDMLFDKQEVLKYRAPEAAEYRDTPYTIDSGVEDSSG